MPPNSRPTVRTRMVRPRGRARLGVYAPGGPAPARWGGNLVTYDYGAALAQLLGPGDLGYRPSHIYFEYKNAAGPVALPSYDRSGAAAYYAGLSGVSGVDVLRVPLVAGPVTSSDGGLYPLGNVNRFMAITSGDTGVYGRPFDADSLSTVYGAALAAAPAPGDPSRDVVFSRIYFGPDDQLAKPPGLQLALDWEITWQ